MLSRAVGIPGEDGRTVRTVGSLSDVDRRKVLEDQLREAALFDPVTGLANRRLFLDRLAVAMEQPTRRPGARFAVLFLDLDGFKLINDSLGHLVGDDLLRAVGTRLREQVRTVDTAARFGGDEFALLMTDPVPDDLLVVARRIQARIAEPVQLGEQEIPSRPASASPPETAYTDAEEVPATRTSPRTGPGVRARHRVRLRPYDAQA
jgi:diguanylate cyclase (GGDEF)-like protein